ncbi:hypothetical protein LUZ60_016977 [Juncus effusus]|nr:hypothetical protein LUZ60_016977 [Juncus effusus]
MASKGPRSKLDHESRAKRQKALEAPKEPPRPKSHWDHVLEEMAWLSKDFEAERKWKMSLAKRVALRATKSFTDFETRGEKKLKGEEQRLRKVALNISKDVKKFWTKIEKLVVYKYQLEAEERKKKALDKQLNYLLGQTERYSTMLAENLVSSQTDPTNQPSCSKTEEEKQNPNYSNNLELDLPSSSNKEEEKQIPNISNNLELDLDKADSDDEYENQSDEEMEDDERTIEEDEEKITEEERDAELAALEAEADLPLEEILKAYSKSKTSSVSSSDFSSDTDTDEPPTKKLKSIIDHHQENGVVHSVEMKPLKDVYLDTENSEGKNVNKPSILDSPIRDEGEINGDSSCIDQQEDTDYEASDNEDKDDEATLSEEEELAKKENANDTDEVDLLQKESEMSIEELLARYKKDEFQDEEMQETEPQNEATNPDSNGSHSENPNQIQETPTPVTQTPVTQNPPNQENQENQENEESTIENAAAAARSAQPTGNTFSTTQVRTKFPFLLKFPLREYQHIGLDWLVTMYEKRLNGILADEMGLGKTIMTIALLAHLACEKGIWGPHLIVVPTSVMLNWETEFLKWCPAFKILTYFGSAKERKQKRQGWMKLNSFHVCITTYRLVIQDSKAFKRKKWKYLILDEAHLIKNWKSQRWQTLLNFNSKRRILLTGTPLQNDLMELWSLMHFLMPHIFQSHQEFKDWFCNPISHMVEGQEKVNREVVDRLHNVLRPFILRRLKRDVEKQLPQKHEHVIYCRLSKRQRNLYEDFINSNETQATLNNGNFFGMISVIMQLRKVCNHPDLFEGRPIISAFDMSGIEMQVSKNVCSVLQVGPFCKVDLEEMNLVFTKNEFDMSSWESDLVGNIVSSPKYLINDGYKRAQKHGYRSSIFEEIQRGIMEEREREMKEREESVAWWNRIRCEKKPIYGTDLREILTIKHPIYDISEKKNNPSYYMDYSSKLADIILSPVERFRKMCEIISAFLFAIPASRAPQPNFWCTKWRSPVFFSPSFISKCTNVFSPLFTPIRPAIVRRQLYFPDRRLIQFDCGKLQQLSILLRKLRFEGHRALIFTQMTKMLDVLEEFINLYGYTYLRLDGSTPPEERQTLMQRFNTNPKFFLFILSTRSGGVGINLVGADTVIFYDSDWNPAMDQQAQDRCHRIGQTREVNIYRLISESTIEENILKKANQKRVLDNLVIQSGSYNTEFFKKLDPLELFKGINEKNNDKNDNNKENNENKSDDVDLEAALKQAEDEADYMALKKVEEEEDLDKEEFNEEAVGRSEPLDEDELANEDERGNDKEEKGGNDENALRMVVGGGEEEMDMLADVRQLAEAARAAGQASWSFENQLRPIDRYAMRYLEVWDPVVNRAAMEEQAEAQEEEWELDRIERLKDEMEAEMDQDQEQPLLYERWDADLATEAYRQHVEALTQQKLMEEMEYQAQLAREQEEYEKNLNNNTAEEGAKASEKKAKSSSKRKAKKKAKKFKSLKKGKLASKSETYCSDTASEPDDYLIDDYNSTSPESIYSAADSPPPQHNLPPIKKRKLLILDEEKEKENSSKIAKKSKKNPKFNSAPPNSSLPPNKRLMEITEFNPKPVIKPVIKPVMKPKRTVPSVTISNIPSKNIIIVKPEKMKKKGGIKTDPWSNQEDAVLCAAVKEFGSNWGLVSELVYGAPGSGGYRGRWRHPVHCCERFRDLFFKHVLESNNVSNNNGGGGNSNNLEKAAATGVGKAVLKVTEDQIGTLLNITSNLPDNELLLQRHFMAILSSVWRSRCHHHDPPHQQTLNLVPSSSRSNNLTLNKTPQRNNYNLVMKALLSVNNSDRADRLAQEQQLALSNNNDNIKRERMDLVLGFVKENEESEGEFPTAVSVSIFCEPKSFDEVAPPGPSDLTQQFSRRVSETRFRVASKACFEGEGSQWATSSAFPTFDSSRYKTGTKSFLFGKHKSPFSSKSKSLKNSNNNNNNNNNNDSYGPPPDQVKKPLIVPPVRISEDNSETEKIFADSVSDETDLEMVQHEFDPSFTEGLESLDSISDFTDIG